MGLEGKREMSGEEEVREGKGDFREGKGNEGR